MQVYDMDPVREQEVELAGYLDAIKTPECNYLGEILYTAGENCMLGGIDSIDIKTALKIWKMVELSRTFTHEQAKKIRM